MSDGEDDGRIVSRIVMPAIEIVFPGGRLQRHTLPVNRSVRPGAATPPGGETVRRFMKAYVEGIHYYKTHKALSLAVIARYLKTSDTEAVEEAYNEIGLKRTPSKPYPTLKGIQLILDEIGEKNPKAKGMKPEAFVDLRFVKELDESGAIDRLYR